jgi:hypothetical protein
MSYLRLTLPYHPPESFSPNSRKHWGARRRDRLAVEADITALIIGQLGYFTPPYFQKGRIDYTVIVPDKRERDRDNFIARTKPITDALVRSGVFPNDSSRYVDIALGFAVEKGRRATIIEVRAGL